MYKWIMTILLSVACIVGVTALIIQTNDHSKEVAKEKEGGPAAGGMPAVTLDEAAAGTIFKANCVACHGANLEGGAGPNLQKVGTKMTDQQIYKKIQNGGGVMPKFKGTLKDEEIANLAQWLATHK